MNLINKPKKNETFTFLIVTLLLVVSGLPHNGRAEEVVLQYFGTSWTEITERLPEVAEAGYTALWLPSPFKGGSGIWSVGYDVYDRFDLGSKDQMYTVQTRYGTETELIHLVNMAHRFGLRVYFDNVMAHNGGPIIYGEPGTLSENGFVPEDFHLIRTGSNTYTKADWPNWNDEWQVLNRNPFGMDIAHESPNTSFGENEGDDYPKWSGIRHPYNPEYYPDTDLPIVFSNGTTNVTYYTYANKEPFEDVGYTNSSLIYVSGTYGRFDWEDVNTNGQHDAGEASEPFEDTGIDPGRSEHQTLEWGYADGIYNMGNPYAEDVNAMLFRAVRWFVDRVKPDGFRLDAVKHVPDYFFGKKDFPKDASDWGYGGQIQAQFNISRGYADWNNHRDTVFNNVQPRDDALLYGEHLGAPPSEDGYLSAGMRIANDNFLNTVKYNIGSNLSGMGSPSYGLYGGPAVSMPYVMSHDNNYLFSGDREQSHAVMITREGIPIVYTDGYNQSGAPDWFPKPAEVPFLGQFGNDWLPNLLEINRNFGWGYQSSRWEDANYTSYTRYDEDLGNNDHGVYMVFAMSKNYNEGVWPQMQGWATFPDGARLFNYSKYNYGNQVKVESGNIVNMDDSDIYIAPNEYYAYSWRIPDMPTVWGNHITNDVRPIMIFENGEAAETVTVTRTDGRDGDPAFNPYGLPDSDPGDYSYQIELPRITSPTNIRFVARGDGSTENIQMKLDGGIDLNSQMAFITQDYGTRDNPPATSKDRFLGFEQMQYIQRGAEKFAAIDTARNTIGSAGAETYQCTIGSAGFISVDGTGVNSSVSTADWAYHDPEGTDYTESSLQFIPAPESAAGLPVTVWVKVGYTGAVNRAAIYYTTDGTNPGGSLGTGKGSTQVVEMQLQTNGTFDGYSVPEWWSGTIPALTHGTELRYKVAVYNNNASSRFPWSDDDIAVVPHMETQFEITGFDAATVPHYPNNDRGELSAGLEDGFHILRTKAFLGRGAGDTPICRENIQTFYYDAETPDGRIVWPQADGITLESSYYGVVLMTDMTVEEVWYCIDDVDASNDDDQTGSSNGNGEWVQAQKALNPAPESGGPLEQRWEFGYVNIPNIVGSASIEVVLREATSSTNLSLSAEEGHFTTLSRTVLTDSSGSGARMFITEPSGDGQTLGMGSNLTIRFSKWLAEGGLSASQLLSYFTLSIDDQVATPLAESVTWDATADEHQIDYSLPNFYNGNPSFLHTIAVSFERSGYPSLEAIRQAYSEVNDDSNSDGIPDAWELQWNIDVADLSPGSDYDGDGVNDYWEYIANTDPTDSNMYFRVSDNFMQTNGVYYSLVFNASHNREYYIWYTDALSTTNAWTQYSGIPFSGTGQFEEYGVNTSDKTNCFYKIEVALPEQQGL